MEFWITLLFALGNLCLCMGIAFGVFFLLRPLLLRLVTPQQRVWMWYIFWYSLPFFQVWAAVTWGRIFPVTVWDLIGAAAPVEYGWARLFEGPKFLPSEYTGPGSYVFTLPGGGQVPVALTDGLCMAVAAVYLAGAACLAVRMVRRNRALRRLGRTGTSLQIRRKTTFGYGIETAKVRIVSGLPTSFVLDNEVYLQKELPPGRQRLVLLHELDHLHLRHGMIKGYMSFALIAGWWNPPGHGALLRRQDHGAPLPPGAAGVRPDSGGAGLRTAAVGRAPGLRGERRGAPGEGPAGLEAPDHPPKSAGPVRGGTGHVPLSGHAVRGRPALLNAQARRKIRR